MANKKAKTKDAITVQQIGSPIRRDSKQKLHLKGLGLGKINAVRELEDTPEVRGLIRSAPHGASC